MGKPKSGKKAVALWNKGNSFSEILQERKDLGLSNVHQSQLVELLIMGRADPREPNLFDYVEVPVMGGPNNPKSEAG